MGIKVAYGKRGDITGAIESGVIPKDSLVITSDAKEAELYFYDTDGQIKYVSERKRFETMDEAREWIKTYDCTGHIISIYDGGDWAPYIVTSGGELAYIETTEWVHPDLAQNDPDAKDYVKNRPCVVGEDGALAWNVPPVSDATILDALKEIDALPVVTDGGKILTANHKILLW